MRGRSRKREGEEEGREGRPGARGEEGEIQRGSTKRVTRARARVSKRVKRPRMRNRTGLGANFTAARGERSAGIKVKVKDDVVTARREKGRSLLLVIFGSPLSILRIELITF